MKTEVPALIWTNMKKIVFSLAVLAAIITACTVKNNPVIPEDNPAPGEETIVPEEPAAEGIPFVATVSASREDPKTRSIAESGSDLAVNWEENEEIALIYTAGGTPVNTTARVSSVDSGTGAAIITASLDASVTDNTPVTLIFPASAADGTTGNILSTALSAQDGALSNNRDIRKGSGTIRVSGTATLQDGATLVAQYAICKFEIKDIDGSNNLSVSSFKVKDASGNVITTITPSPASSTLYVSLPASSSLTWFEAVASGKSYVAKATAGLSAGVFYTPTLKMATIGNVIGANFKFYKDKNAAVSAGTTAAAIIAYVGDDTAETGFKNGLAISMKNTSGGTVQWSTSSTAVNPNTYSTAALAIAAKESGSSLSSGRGTDSYPAFKAALANDISLESGISATAPSGTSGWFLASMFQWNNILKGLGGASTDISGVVNNDFKIDKYYTIIQASWNDDSYVTPHQIGRTGSYQDKFWTSSERSADYAWDYYAQNGTVVDNYKTNYMSVRAALAF